MDTKALLDRFLGPNAAAGAGDLATRARGALGGNAGALLGGAAAGGLLTLLLGGGKPGKVVGRVATLGGAAALGALAYRAWQGWQQNTPPAAAAAAPPAALPPPEFQAAAPDFQLALIRAMAGAAMADGHIDGTEREAIFAQVDRIGLEPEAKAFVFDMLSRAPTLEEIAAGAATPEQGAELYLAARLVIDPDQASERMWLEALAHRLRLPAGLAAHLDAQAAALAQ
ncbi:DUF533 domain-containing protein [Roseomonas sp. HF4]|uniref:DUF533 domain-containing protein n=1 Tax=Roseomonas sp. HF4 TaxID=2562313 RepID=UPI0010C03CDD|nr:DUF533 domain-containing protein [Roseomonas sp. HF4]